jgi:formylglycine-generating enzyme
VIRRGRALCAAAIAVSAMGCVSDLVVSEDIPDAGSGVDANSGGSAGTRAPDASTGGGPADASTSDRLADTQGSGGVANTDAADTGAAGIVNDGAVDADGAAGAGGTGGNDAGGTGGIGTGGAGGSDGSAAGGSTGSGGVDASATGGSAGTGGVDASADAGTGGASGTGGSGGSDASVGTGGAGGGADAGGVAEDGGTFVPSSPSCAGGLTCAGTSCCTSINVPGGTFPQGRGTEDCGVVGCQTGVGNEGCPVGDDCQAYEQPEHLTTVSPFALDQYEVTVGRFRNFVNAYVSNSASAPAGGSGAHPLIPGTGWDPSWNQRLPADKAALKLALHCPPGPYTWTDAKVDDPHEQKPIDCVTWYEAFAFCIWDGGRLPTEAEWEYTAAGGEQNRLYPWGSSAPSMSQAVYGCQAYSGGTCVALPVGSMSQGIGRWGHADLGGNAWEWAFDYIGSYTPAPRTDYASLVPAGNLNRVYRGGGMGDGPVGLRATFRNMYGEGTRYDSLGFRCARTVQASPDAGAPTDGGAGTGTAVDVGPFVPSSPSCAGSPICNSESCCISIDVPGGTFLQGRATEDCGVVGCQTGVGNEGCPVGSSCAASEQPEHPSTVFSFALDKYEVTVGRFRKFVAAYEGGWRPGVGTGRNPNVWEGDTSWRSGWDDSAGAAINLPAPGAFTDTQHLKIDAALGTWTDALGSPTQESRPINSVNWYEAFAFCIWDGGRLPTESEWEYAAAGGAENRLYPWGSAAPTTSLAVYGCQAYPGGTCVALPVGSTPAGNGRWGHADLAGNIWEWVLDQNDGSYPLVSDNYANATSGAVGGKGLRGGGFHVGANVRAAARDVGSTSSHGSNVGFRCARDPARQSCAGGLTCNGESCCTTISVPGGTFMQGGSPEVTPPAHSSTVSGFALDKYEVTVGQFRNFVRAYVDNTTSAPPDGAGVNPAVPGTGWQSAWNTYLPADRTAFTDSFHLKSDPVDQTWTDSAGTAAQESRAINSVSWYEAFAFCIWDGGRLPTESEWEYAAAGGAENRLYPWGNTPVPDCAHANSHAGSTYCGPGGTAVVSSVGSYAAGNGKWGHADLAGNLDEWVFDWYGAYAASPASDFANTASGSARVIRGGDFGSEDPAILKAAFRLSQTPNYHNGGGLGFRCARAAQ